MFLLHAVFPPLPLIILFFLFWLVSVALLIKGVRSVSSDKYKRNLSEIGWIFIAVLIIQVLAYSVFNGVIQDALTFITFPFGLIVGIPFLFVFDTRNYPTYLMCILFGIALNFLSTIGFVEFLRQKNKSYKLN